MNEKRDKIQIIFDILTAIQKKGGKIKPTHLLYKANLSHQRMKKYLSELLDKKMIEEIDEKDGNKFYIITQKGNQFIAEFDKIKQFTESFGL
ncbi:MAG TPA: winged helix-turn-helix domain-containing protein [Candidatus Nanoarchaeia archaeon]|nr:winged helix-turn-helix domain-containing protein [Candidatus Nanoarchaeia archaeon]